VVFTSDGSRNEGIDTRIGEPNAVLRVFYRSVVMKRELWNTARLTVCKSIFAPIRTYSHESWVMTERILSQEQMAEMGFLRRVHAVTKGRTEVRLLPGRETSLAPPYLSLGCFRE